MNKITNITRKEIFNLLFNGYDDYDVLGNSITYRICYFGDLDEVQFLSKLYNLKGLPSSDYRFQNAEEDIIHHTQINDDYQIDFILTDSRFNLKESSDEILLDFLCKVFHPEVRVENGYWREILKKINDALIKDGIELYSNSKISGRDVFGWRYYKPTEPFLPFSIRHRREIENKILKFSIPKPIREQIYSQILIYDSVIYATTETGWNYNYNATTKLLSKISDFYEPRCFNDSNQYVVTKNLEQFILHTRPYCLLDAIEIYSSIITNNGFDAIVNKIFENEQFNYKIENGIIRSSIYANIEANIGKSMECGVKELLQKATEYYNRGNKEVAVEKLWDAFERLKTIINPNDKSRSINHLIYKISYGVPEYKSIIETEFSTLTKIGNNFRIRHHEVNKIEINNEYYYDYLYHRCLALINLAINFINK